MRFIEIANPEDQLALWRMVSNSMWKAFGEPSPEASMSNNQQFKPIQAPGVKAVSTPSMMNQPLAHGIHGVSSISGTGGKKPKTNRPIKVPKPKKAPMAPAPKPLPKPKPLAPTPLQIKNQQQKSQKEYAAQVRKELSKNPIKPHPGAPKPLPGNIISPVDVPRNTKEREQLRGQARGELPWRPM
jgi:hypothetical protein